MAIHTKKHPCAGKCTQYSDEQCATCLVQDQDQTPKNKLTRFSAKVSLRTEEGGCFDDKYTSNDAPDSPNNALLAVIERLAYVGTITGADVLLAVKKGVNSANNKTGDNHAQS